MQILYYKDQFATIIIEQFYSGDISRKKKSSGTKRHLQNEPIRTDEIVVGYKNA